MCGKLLEYREIVEHSNGRLVFMLLRLEDIMKVRPQRVKRGEGYE
jgi:hypothetical protein